MEAILNWLKLITLSQLTSKVMELVCFRPHNVVLMEEKMVTWNYELIQDSAYVNMTLENDLGECSSCDIYFNKLAQLHDSVGEFAKRAVCIVIAINVKAYY